MTDSERIDWLEAEIARAAERGESACVVLSAWYSGAPSPDGYSVNSGEYAPALGECDSLRDAIDEAAA